MPTMKAWDDFIAAQAKLLGADIADKWLRPLKVIHFDAGNLYLEAEDSFQLLWFEEHIRPKLATELLNNNNRPIQVHLTSAQDKRSIQKEKKKKFNPVDFPLKDLPQFNSDPLDTHATLDNFFPGETNLLTYKFIQELTERLPEHEWANPLYLYGKTGTGKTHLLMAIATAVRKQGSAVLYVTADTFTEHVVLAMRTGNMQEFRKRYRHVDLLIIDDIHKLANRTATQEEFFHTFNALHTAKKQMIFSGNVPPSQIADIEPRLVSRFEWGITMQLKMPDRQELPQILRLQSEALHFPLSEETVQFLIDSFPGSIPSLQKALNALVLRSHLGKAAPTLQPLELTAAKVLIHDLVVMEQKTALTSATILNAVSELYGISKEEILGKAQKHECVLPRQMAMYLCRTLLKLPFIAIGKIFSRDHSTVMTSVQQIQKKQELQDKEITSSLTALMQTLKPD